MALPQRRAPAERIGRFEILRVLGKGAQGRVCLAHDPHLDRCVAVKTLAAGAGGVGSLLEEARMVSRLQHPNIVTLHDAGEEAGEPYLVFEYVEGRTLAAEIARLGRVPAARAADIARQVLRAIACAHSAGIVHRDLKPANIMLTDAGVARVMDFGIARAAGGVEAGGERALFGTPCYMPPEYIDRHEFGERGDVFALGMVLYEMLTGAPAARGASVFETFHRIANLQFPPPSSAATEVDERLDAIVMRALRKDPQARYGSAREMEEALQAWQAPEAGDGEAQTGTLDFLIRRMRHRSDFPALSSTLAEVNRAVASERERTSVLCGAILRDFSLTNKLLRLVNAAHFRQFGGSISTVSRALAILGQDQVRSVALSLVLIDHLQDRAQAGQLRDEVAAAYLAGIVARDLAARLGMRDAEEIFICAMFHRLGRLLATFYLHEEVQAIARLAELREGDEARASREVLGISYAELGRGVAKSWGFPEAITASMAAMPKGSVSAAAFAENRGRSLAELANALVDVARNGGQGGGTKGLAAVAARFGRATGLDAKALAGSLADCARVLERDAGILGFSASRGTLLAAVREWSGSAPPAGAGKTGTATDLGDVVGSTRIGESAPTMIEGRPEEASLGRRQAVLASGVQDITQTLVGDFELNDVLRIILETMFRGIGFKRVLLCIRDPSGGGLRARLGFGDDTEAIVRRGFTVPLEPARDVFHVALSKGADIAIEDLDDERIRPHVPDWYRRLIAARGMVLFPVMVNKRPVALIYADADRPGVLAFAPEELSLLKTLRNQAVLAIRQKS